MNNDDFEKFYESTIKLSLLPYESNHDHVLFCQAIPSQYKSLIIIDKEMNRFQLEMYKKT